MNGFAQHLAISLRLHFRNRMALLYGYLFPLIFLAAFYVLYRHENVPLLFHMGELLTISVLGGACFGLPTTMVSERERGVWRRFRLAPVGTWTVVLSTMVARYLIVVTAGLIQFGAALAVGMTWPHHAGALFLAFTVVSFSFIGLGLVIAMLADSVPAVQALGQCLFLPMLIIGGVAVPLASLPLWAQHLSAFFPGRYAVDALQACVTANGFPAIRFDLVALVGIGFAGCVAGAKLFRWESGQRFGAIMGKSWLLVALAAWLAVGGVAESRHRIAVAPRADVAAPAPAAPAKPVVVPPQPWELLTEAQIDALDYRVPEDSGIVAPIAGENDVPDENVAVTLARVERDLPQWAPGHVKDPVQRVRNLLSIAGVPDLVQNPAERFVPAIVLRHLQTLYPAPKLVRLCAWIALHPEEGTYVGDVSELGLRGAGAPELVGERVHFYAIKFAARVSGRPTNQN